MSIDMLLPDDRVFAENFLHEIHHALVKSTESIVQQAVKDAEIEIRRKIASMMIARLERDFDFMKNGSTLTITAKGFFDAESK